MPCHFRCALSALLLFALACTAPPLEAFCPVPDQGTPAERQSALCACTHPLIEAFYPQNVRWKHDILFVVSNGPGMAAKQQALAKAYAELVTIMNAADFDYQIGVVSTDVGSWTAPGTIWSTSAGACDSFSGDDGRLQMTSCQDRPGLSPEARAACSTVCPDPSFMPSGQALLTRHNGKTNVREALVPDPKSGQLVDRGPEYALGCMLMLGDGGCQVSSPLESMRRALDGHSPANKGFPRSGVHLMIFMLSDADDCSMQPGRRGENDPRTQDCTSPDPNAPPGCYGLGAYRCLAGDVACNEPLNTAGTKTGCHQRPDSPLEPIDGYVQFFRELSQDRFVEVFGFWPLPALGDSGLMLVTQDPRVPGSPGLRATPSAASGCRATSGPALSGMPQRRLSKFLTALEGERYTQSREPLPEYSVCDPSHYLPVEQFSSTIHTKLGLRCLPGIPQLDAQGLPRCEVGEVPESDMNAIPDKLMPLCSAKCCAEGPFSANRISACMPEPEDCYCIRREEPGACTGTAELMVWSKDNADPPPNGTFVNVRCAIECDPAKLTR